MAQITFDSVTALLLPYPPGGVAPGERREDMLDGVWEDGFYTVFPINECKDELPQDFPTRQDAEEYAEEEFGEGNFIIETPF